ncbi:Inosine/uridine-preferring nucleoside hydrolase [Metallosphaera sedula]|uniref:Inosine/uridine-preferring nucleoside hydrolase n=3 Tax=Metallosphaera TaxID=41980 RepID=A4YFH2_METS5|nr:MULTISPECIES: nucleoside hydrolase [Metallosphaera]ABP95174.1 Inosine/uridine-preferring nucleoside hydrolase [Metallosphaera sedula DSM 5348]AIM27160.1 Inosine/uridine-preferring nucleoside hydrolase [Metallosphaera sedula]AKV74062.1 nucleoside hydrolase [Metallosphaera sedula]AKV76302.1 nucleoside hydrolase [Metallosphaera sedula]AKV78553.1 nucleoside hydrolase [Metallosphaera sedula]
MRHFIIDCDTAEDDIFSLFLLLHKGMKVHGITVVEGNVSFPVEVRNALWASDFARRYFKVDLKVYPGMERPLIKGFRTVENVHGKGGIGDSALETNAKPEPKHAVDFILETADRYPGELEFLAISPLTNLAMAYLKDKSLPEKIGKVWVMGGTINGHGNITPAAEYNIWVDPDAAKLVFNAGFDITMVAWDLITQYTVNEEWEEIKRMNTEMSQLYINFYTHYRNFAMTRQKMRGNPHPDLITTAVALDQSVATRVERQFVDVENCDCLTRGATVIDYLGVLGKEPNVNVVYEIDRGKFIAMLLDLLGGQRV